MLIDFSVFDSLFQLIDLFSDIIFSMVKKKSNGLFIQLLKIEKKLSPIVSMG